MLTVEEYISDRKKKDKLDEFNFQNHSENMAQVIQYVTEYFTTYLNIEDYSYEQIKTQQAIDRFKSGISETYPDSKDFIIDYYWKNRKRIDTVVEKTLNDLQDGELFYLPEDDKYVAEVVSKKILGTVTNEEFLNKVSLVVKEYRQSRGEQPSAADLKDLDNALVDWIKETFQTYHVNLYDYAYNIADSFFDSHVETIYDSSRETFYHINQYEYRYQENPFNINELYKRNRHRVFIEDHKGELEMLIMYCWLYYCISDKDYWPEYVKLCMMSHRVHLANYKRVLVPVHISGLEYTCDIESNINYVETKNGILKNFPGESYVLQIVYEKTDDSIWKNIESMQEIIKNLQKSFKEFGAPKLLEFTSPFNSTYFSKEDFFKQYRLLEKGMQRFTGLKIALINGYMKRNKGKEYMFSTIEDIIQLRNTCKELKLHLKLSVDFTDVSGKNILKKELRHMVNALSEIRSFIIAIHLNEVNNWFGYRTLYSDNRGKDHRYIYISNNDEQPLSEFLAGMGMIMQDSRERYLIPNTVKNSRGLEELVDTLLRGGFYFKGEVIENEE